MAINFPNLSRPFDATRQGVRVGGYDSAMETAFFVKIGASDVWMNVSATGKAGAP
jgi:hypothetical protein